MGVVKIDIRVLNSKPKRVKVGGSRKRKQLQLKKPTSKDTATGYYMIFLQKIMNYMDQYPEMKWFYVVVDNTPIHTADRIEEMISKRGHRSIYHPPYLPELNPIKSYWSITKGYKKGTTVVNIL